MTTTLNQQDIEYIIRKHMERQSALTDGPKVERVDLLTIKDNNLSYRSEAIVRFEDPKPDSQQPKPENSNEPAH